MPAHESEAAVYRISPVRSGKDRYDNDILLGRLGMLNLQIGIDKFTGDLICSLHCRDAVL